MFYPMVCTDCQSEFALRAGQAAGALEDTFAEGVQLLEHPQRCTLFVGQVEGRVEIPWGFDSGKPDQCTDFTEAFDQDNPLEERRIGFGRIDGP